jgi:hypothetical protein
MSRIENALKHVVSTSPANTFNNNNPVLQAVMLHTDANEELTEVLGQDLSSEERSALFLCLLDMYTDSLDGEMKEACEVVREHMHDV